MTLAYAELKYVVLSVNLVGTNFVCFQDEILDS